MPCSSPIAAHIHPSHPADPFIFQQPDDDLDFQCYFGSLDVNVVGAACSGTVLADLHAQVHVLLHTFELEVLDGLRVLFVLILDDFLLLLPPHHNADTLGWVRLERKFIQ